MRHRQHRRRTVPALRLSEHRRIRSSEEHVGDDARRSGTRGIFRRLQGNGREGGKTQTVENTYVPPIPFLTTLQISTVFRVFA